MIEIDEIISNAEYCADVYEKMNNAMPPALQVSDYKRHAEDHRQLAGWLKDYKRLKEQEPCEDATSQEFLELVVKYPPKDLCTYPEYRGKPYYSIKYYENEECHVGYGTYKPEVLSRYLKDYFITPVNLQPKTGHWIDKDIRGSIEPYCSVCGDSVDTMYHYDYCPNCGVKMREVKE